MTQLVNAGALDREVRRAMLALRGDVDELSTTLNATPWTALTLTAPWVNYGLGWTTAGIRRIGDIVYVRGLIGGGTVGAPIATLPVGFRPALNAPLGSGQIDYGAGYQTARVDVKSSGVIIAYWNSGAAAGYLSLDLAFSVL